MKDNFKLDELPKHNIYQVPEDYFDRLPMQIMARTATAPAYTSHAQTLWQSMRMIVAPLVLLLVFLGVFYMNVPAKTEQGPLNLAALHDQEIVDYLSTYATLESSDFAELNSIEKQELTADVLNVSAQTAEEELEYYNINNIDY